MLACRLEAARDECDLREYSASRREHWSNDYAEEDAADKWACRSAAIDEIIAEWKDAASFAMRIARTLTLLERTAIAPGPRHTSYTLTEHMQALSGHFLIFRRNFPM